MGFARRRRLTAWLTEKIHQAYRVLRGDEGVGIEHQDELCCRNGEIGMVRGGWREEDPHRSRSLAVAST